RTPNGEDGHDDWKGGRSGFRMDWGDNLTVQGDVYRVLTNQVNNTPLLAAPFSLVENEMMESNGANILAHWKKNLDSGDLLSVQTLLHAQRGIFDLEGQYNFAPSGRHEFITGGGYRYIRDDLQNAPSVTFDPASRGDNYFSFFAQDKIALSPDRWYLTLGSKF